MTLSTLVTRRRAGSPVCTCVAAIDASMAAHGSNTCVAIELFSGAVVVASCKTVERTRGKPAVIVASYCPFCGKGYAREDDEASDETDEAAHA